LWIQQVAGAKRGPSSASLPSAPTSSAQRPTGTSGWFGDFPETQSSSSSSGWGYKIVWYYVELKEENTMRHAIIIFKKGSNQWAFSYGEMVTSASKGKDIDINGIYTKEDWKSKVMKEGPCSVTKKTVEEVGALWHDYYRPARRTLPTVAGMSTMLISATFWERK
jgi:hypothetical protein